MALVEFVFGAGVRVLNLCEEAKQCEAEVCRIAVRTQNVLGTLKGTSRGWRQKRGKKGKGRGPGDEARAGSVRRPGGGRCARRGHLRHRDGGDLPREGRGDQEGEGRARFRPDHGGLQARGRDSLRHASREHRGSGCFRPGRRRQSTLPCHGAHAGKLVRFAGVGRNRNGSHGEGLRFLHVHGIVHRDLKSLNVLLDSAWTAKISDFGLAKVNSTVAASTGGGGYHSKVGSDFWMAPEVHSNRRETKASDVFSNHVCMWEVFAQERAGHGKPIGERLQSNPDARLPPLSDLGSEAVESNVRNIVDRCGYGEPSDRPAMEDVCSVITRVLRHIENPDVNPLEAVAPAPRPRHAPTSSAAVAASSPSAAKAFRSTGKDGYVNPHRTLATAAMSTASSVSASASRPQGAPTPPPWDPHASVGPALPSRGSRGPPPPLPSRRSSTSSGPAARQGRSPVPGSRAAPSGTGSTAKRDDRGVLLMLLYQCSPPPPPGNPSATSGWKLSTEWGGSTSMNRWYGVSTRHEDVTMVGSERVTGLMLPGNGLCGELPEELMLLDCLALLDLKDNELVGAFSPSIGNLRALQTLDLSGNKLTGAIPSELGDLLSLKSLDLHHTGLYGDIPVSLSNLSNLERLDLSSSDVWGNIPKEFSKLAALRVLRLGTNRLSGEIPYALAKLDKLEELDLGGNNLTGVILVGTWPTLRILDFSAKTLERWIPPEIMGLESLTTLRLYRNFNLSGGIPPWLGSMITLDEIDLSATRLGGEIPKELGDLPRLLTLTLGSCGLEGPIPPELGRLKHLKHLALFGNSLTGPIPQTILQLPALRNLNLERNNLKVTKARIGGTKGAIKQILPKGCNIRL